MRPIQIAIDGPAGSGKSTIAKLLAQRLRFTYIDTGAMYRALTLVAMEKGISDGDASALAKLAENTAIVLACSPDGRQLVFCEGRDVSAAIRAPFISQHVSQVASHAGVRREMVTKQQQMARNQDVVMDGRDIGTVVLPQAECKIFLTASLEERARRRYNELLEKGFKEKLGVLTDEMEKRDRDDATREIGPLRPAAEAVMIDTTTMSQEDVVESILQLCMRKRGG